MKHKIASLFIFTAVVFAGVAQAQVTFVLPTAEEFGELTDIEKIELFEDYQALPFDEMKSVQSDVSSMDSEDYLFILSEYDRLMEYGFVDESLAVEEPPIEAPVVVSPEENNNNSIIILGGIAVIVVLVLIVLFTLSKRNKPKDETPPEEKINF